MKELRIKAEIFSRVSGYYRPVVNFNPGKREEFSERKNLTFSMSTLPDLIVNLLQEQIEQ